MRAVAEKSKPRSNTSRVEKNRCRINLVKVKHVELENFDKMSVLKLKENGYKNKSTEHSRRKNQNNKGKTLHSSKVSTDQMELTQQTFEDSDQEIYIDDTENEEINNTEFNINR